MDRLQEQRPILFGEVLFDLFPDGSVVLGGAPFNVAWHLQAFGLSPLLISRVGSDALGRQISSAMIEWGMDRSGLQLDSAHQTGTVEVSLADGEPGFDIARQRAFDFIDRYALPPIRTDGPLYFGSLALRNSVSQETLWELKQCSEGSTFVDVNLRPPWWTRELVLEMLAGANLIKLNQHELQQLVPDATDLESRAQRLLAEMGAQQLVVTQGKAGASAFLAGGSSARINPEPASLVVDTVGAGDAFSAVLLLGQARGWSLQLTLERAHSFASAIVGVRGGIVRERDFYLQFVDRWVSGVGQTNPMRHGQGHMSDVAEVSEWCGK